jgi:hypothetical protein
MADEDGADQQELEREWAAAVQDRAARVEAALRAGRQAEALRASLADPPFASKDAGVKDKSYEVVMRALLATAAKEDQLMAFLDGLADADATDALMKYVLRGLRTPDNAAVLLRVHGLLVERAGMGCLVRAMVDRKTA